MLTHEQAVQRPADTWEMFSAIRFELSLVVAGGGRITEVWNCGYKQGVWQ